MTPTARRRSAQLAISLAVAAACIWLLHAGALPVFPPAHAWGRVRWWAPGVYLVLWSGVHVLRAVRWHWMLLPLGRVRLATVLAVGFVGFAAVVALPLRSGELVRPVLLRRRAGVSGWAATGTVAAERIVDGLVLSLLLLLSLELGGPVQQLATRVGNISVDLTVIPRAAGAALGMFVAAFALLGGFYWRREQARRLTERALGIVSPTVGHWVAERLARTADGLHFLPSPRHAGPFVLITIAYWMLNGAAAWLLARGVGFGNFSYWQGCVIVGVLALGILVPNAPGFFGAFQLSVYAGLLLYFPLPQVEQAGAVYVFLVYASQLAIIFGAAAGSLALGRLTVREAVALEPEADKLPGG